MCYSSFFFFSSRRRHTRCSRDWSSDVCSSDLMVGTGMLWVGWYGFNAGSAVAADVIAANAFTTTTIATAVASFVWPMAEYMLKGNPSFLGFCSGAVAGLVVITPACGFVTSSGAVVIGIAAGLVPFFFCYKV